MGKPTWEQIEKIVNIIIEYDETMAKLCDVIKIMCPSSYKPFVDFHNPLSTLEVLYPDISDRVSYWMYEAGEYGDGSAIVEWGDGSEMIVKRSDIQSLRLVLEKDNLLEEGKQTEEILKDRAQEVNG